MKTISKSSWHYKLYRYIGNVLEGPEYLNPWTKAKRKDKALPKSLCPYAWTIFLGLVGTVALMPIWLLAFTVVLIVTAVIFVASWLNEHVSLSFPERAEKPEKPEKPKRKKRPSLVASYMKARKQKVCPMIELGD